MIGKLLQFSLLLGIAFVLFVGTTSAQTGTIEGTIIDELTSEPVIGANVFIKSIDKGVVTDTQGRFTISDVAYGTYQLRISYVGYATKTISITVDKQTLTVSQTLAQDVSQLEDVVVTAYGVEQQMNDLTYSAQKVSAEEVSQNKNGNILSSLSGRVAGLQVRNSSGVGGSTDIVLRGYSSLTGNNQALIVIDGVPMTNFKPADDGLSYYNISNSGVDLNSENIESINVLKGPAATALYGSRASNGALIIQTKEGAPSGENTDISFESNVGVRLLDGETLPTYQQEYGAGYTDGFLEIADPFTEDPDDIALAARYPADASWGPAYDSDMNVYQWDSFYEDSPNYGKATP